MPSLIECPFCGKKSIAIREKPSVLQVRKSRGSGQSGNLTYRTKPDIEICNGCKECGKSQNEIRDKFEGKVSNKDAIGRCVWCGNPCPSDKIECEECRTK